MIQGNVGAEISENTDSEVFTDMSVDVTVLVVLLPNVIDDLRYA